MHHIEAPAARDEQRRAGAARENLDAGRRTVARGTDEPHARPGAEQADRLDLAVAGVRHEEHRARARERARAAKARRAHRADRVARRARHADASVETSPVGYVTARMQLLPASATYTVAPSAETSTAAGDENFAAFARPSCREGRAAVRARA